MTLQASYEGTLLVSIDTTTGAKTFKVTPELTNPDGVLKIGIGLENEEWFEVTGTDTVADTITTTLRGLSLTVTSTLTEVAGNRKEHFPGEKIAIVTFPNLFHTQNTDTGTTETDWNINSGGSQLILDSAGLTADRVFTYPDNAGVVVIDGAGQNLQNKTITSPILNGTLSGTAFLDEDTLVSDSAIAAASQQSIKAYVDTQVATLPTGSIFNNAVYNGTATGTAILDEDTLVSNSDTKLATQQSIKAYADALAIAGSPDATTIAKGIAELATAAEMTTGTDTTRTITPDAFVQSDFGVRDVQMIVFNFTNDVSTGDGKFYFKVSSRLNGMNLVSVNAEVITAGTTGTTDIQIANVTDAVDMLSTVITIDSTETGSETAATPAVIDAANDDVATNDILRIDVDAISTTAPKGLLLNLGFQRP